MSKSLSMDITLKNLFKFAFPSIVSMVFMSLYTIVDGVFVSRLINTDALSAINIVFPLISIVTAVGAMLGTGATASISKKLGEKKDVEARQDFSFIMICSLVLIIIFITISLIFLKPIIYFLGADDSVYEYCYRYISVLILFWPAGILQIQFQYFLIAAGKPSLSLFSTILGGITNMILDYILIAVFDMGIAGAAVATGLGYCVPALLGLFYFLFYRKGFLYFVKPKKNWRVLLKSTTNGVSEMVSNLSASITTLLFNLIMMHYLGSDGVAAITIVLYVDFLLVAVSFGYSMGVAPLIGYNYGSGDENKLKTIFKISIKFFGIFSVIVTLCTFIFPQEMVSVFTPKGSPVFDIAVRGMIIFACSYLFIGFNVFFSALYTALSNGRVSAILSLARTLIFLVLCTILLTLIIGADGVWFAIPLAEILSFFLGIYYIRKLSGEYHYY